LITYRFSFIIEIAVNYKGGIDLSEPAVDFGGVEAIKGFSYQNAVSTFILLSNYDNPSFYLVPEGNEDIDVFLSDKRYYLQIKSQSLSASNIVRPKKQEAASILEKLHSKKRLAGDVYKLACTDCSCKDDNSGEKSPLFSSVDDLAPILRYKLVINKAKTVNHYQCATPEQQQEIIKNYENTYVLITPFSKEVSSYHTFLYGVLVKKSIATNAVKSRNLLAIINEVITTKSTYKASNPSLYAGKMITGEHIAPLVSTNKAEELFEQCLEDTGYETLQKYNIRASKAKIAIPLFNDRYYCDLKYLLDKTPDLSKNKYQIKTYIEKALEIFTSRQSELALELSTSDIISRIIKYFIDKEFQNDNK